MDTKKPLIQSVERALDILDLIADEKKPLRSNDISKELNLHTSTANNLIRTLYKRGYLTQDAEGKYYIGSRCYCLGILCNQWHHLKEVADPLLQELSQITGDTSFLGVNAGKRLICLTLTEGSGAIVVSTKQAWLEHMHCTAAGKIVLAYDPSKLLDSLRLETEFKCYTAKTIVNFSDLKAEITKTEKRGASVCIDESTEGVAAIGVPVFDKNGQFLAALAQTFPSYFIEKDKNLIDERIKVLTTYSEKISSTYNQ